MPNEKSERLLSEIGEALAEDTAYPLDGTLLYARVTEQSVAPSIFKNRGNHILYRSPNLNVIGDLLIDLWEAEDADKRWAEVEYLIGDGRFEATYVYADAIDPKEDTFVRRKRIVQKHFGDKPIVYPEPTLGNDDTFYDF